MRISTIVTLLPLLFSSAIFASVWTVDLDGGGDFSEIQSALDQATNGDTIIVNEGIYWGDRNTELNFQGKAITLQSSQGPLKTVIDCYNFPNGDFREKRAFIFTSSEDASTVVDGFTIRNGQNYGVGGGIYCRDSSPTFKNCTVEGCYAQRGGGFFGTNCQSAFINCQFRNNYAEDSGGGLHFAYYSDVILERCVIEGNESQHEGGGISLGDGKLSLYNCMVSGNDSEQGAAISGERFIAYNCTFTQNYSYYGNLFGYNTWNSELINCIVWGNFTQQNYYYDLYCSYCVIEGRVDWGDHVLNIDPLLTADGHLQKDSPCIDAGDPYWFLNVKDFDGDYPNVDSRTDIGCDQYVDTDQDGLPDWWELKYYGAVTAADPASDTDDDGDNALTEYANSTNPLGSYYVDPNGNDEWDGLASQWDGLHGPKATIQNAIDSVGWTDEIVLNDGIYAGPGNRDISIQKDVYLRSAGGHEKCVIDCDGTIEEPHFAFRINSGRYINQSVLEGIRITDACTPPLQNPQNPEEIKTGAVNIYGPGRPVIRSCDISGNRTTAVVTRTGECEIIDCQLNYNIGGAFWVMSGYYYNSYPPEPKVVKVTNCKMFGNVSEEGGSVITIPQSWRYEPSGFPVFTNCIIAGNVSLSEYGVIYQTNAWEAFARFFNCTITDNKGGGVFVPNYHPNATGYFNTIIAGNSPYNIQPDYGHWQGRESCYISNEVDSVFRMTGTWLSEIDPDTEIDLEQLQGLWIPGDYHLLPESPCVDTGDNRWAIDYYDIDNNGVGREEELPYDMDWKNRIADGDEDGSYIIDIGAYELSNHRPVADAGPDRVEYAWIDGAAQVQLDGTASSDIDSDELTCRWSWTVDGQQYEIDGDAPVIALPAGSHIITLVVHDGSVESEPDQVVCEVIPPVQCNGDMKPNKLVGKGKKLWAFIELPDMISSDAINDVDWGMEPVGVQAGDISFRSKEKGTPSLILEFDRFEVKNALSPGNHQINIVGQLNDGRYIYYTDSIVIK